MGQINGYVTADPDGIQKLIQDILDKMEEMLPKKQDPRAKLARALADYVSGNGQAEYKLVPEKFVKDFETRLIAGNIPFITVPDDRGNMGFIVRDKDRDKFWEIQEDIFSLSTDYYAQNTLSKMVETAKRSKETEVVTLSFDDFDMFNNAKDILNAQNIVYADAENHNPEYDMNGYAIISKDTLFRENGKDLCCAEMHYAMLQMGMDDKYKDILNFDAEKENKNIKQAQIQEFVRHVKAGGNAVLLNPDVDKETHRFKNKPFLICEEGRIYMDGKQLDISESSTAEIETMISAKIADKKRIVFLDRYDYEHTQNENEESAKKYIKKALEDAPYKPTKNTDLKIDLGILINGVSKEASDIIRLNGEGKNKMKAYKKKHEYMANLLRSPDDVHVKEFLEKNNVSMDLLEDLADHFANTNEKGKYEIEVNLEKLDKNLDKKIKEIRTLDDRELAAGKEMEDMAPERN
jgi:hypothetical protein